MAKAAAKAPLKAAAKASGNREAVAGRRQLHFFFVVDCSGSMTGDRMASLNYAIRSAIPAMRAAAADNPENDVLVRVIGFGDKAKWILETPQNLPGFSWTDLKPAGETAMGEALDLLAGVLNGKKMPGPQLPPVIVMVSDGLPTDEVDEGLAALEASEYGKGAVRIAVAIGSDADIPTLQSFMGKSGFKPLQANNAETLVNRIKWAASTPLKVVSSAADWDEPLEQIAEGAASENKDDGELVW